MRIAAAATAFAAFPLLTCFSHRTNRRTGRVAYLSHDSLLGISV